MDAESAKLRLRTAADTSGTVSRVLGKLEDNGRSLDIVAAVANWPQGFRPFVTMADALMFQGVLPPADREIAVLQIAATLNLTYEWNEHLPMARSAGVNDQQIDAISRATWHTDASGAFSEEQLTVLEMVDVLAETGKLPESVWSAGCARLGQDRALEVVMAFAWWGGFIRVIIEGLLPHTRPGTDVTRW